MVDRGLQTGVMCRALGGLGCRGRDMEGLKGRVCSGSSWPGQASDPARGGGVGKRALGQRKATQERGD